MADDTATDTTDAPAEVDERRQEVLDTFAGLLGDGLVEHHLAPGRGLWLRVTREAWPDTARVARDDAGFRFFDFLSAVDWLPSPYGRYEDATTDVAFPPPPPDTAGIEQGYAGGSTRFQVLASLARPGSDLRVFLKADLPDDDLRIGTWTGTFAGASWHERETWEMFGITFDGNPDLRHLYLPGGFEGHPLRKEFPLLARVVKPWPGIVDVEPMPGDDDGGEGGDEGGDA